MFRDNSLEPLYFAWVKVTESNSVTLHRRSLHPSDWVLASSLFSAFVNIVSGLVTAVSPTYLGYRDKTVTICLTLASWP